MKKKCKYFNISLHTLMMITVINQKFKKENKINNTVKIHNLHNKSNISTLPIVGM